MANPFRKIPAGSPVTAFSITAYNRMIDMLNWWSTQGAFGGGPIRNLTDWDQSVFRVKNNTGYDLASYDPVGLDGPIFDPNDGGEPELLCQTSQLGVEPTVADHAGGKWGVMLEAAPDDKIGRCCLAGVVPVRVYVNATTDKYADVIASQTVSGETVYLGTGATGAQILWLDPTATAETIGWAIVRLGGSTAPQCYNANASAAPAYGIAAVTGVHGTLPNVLPQVDKPSSTYRKDYLVIAGTEIPGSGTGAYQPDGEMVKALYGSGTPAVGELWGPTEGQWYLSKGSTGNGDANTTYTRADWGVVVTGIYDATAKILMGRVVTNGRARMCLCSAKIASGHTLETVDGITSMDGGWCPVAASTDTLSVASGFETDDNAAGVIVYDENSNNWRPLDFPCKT